MMGVYYNEYQSLSAQSPEMVSAYTGTGNAHSVTVGRIAYLLGLRGPAVAVDTACSSSLVAVHLACQSLRLREPIWRWPGESTSSCAPDTQIAIAGWGCCPPDGRCKTFDAAADGFVRGEGCGVVVLKRLADAVRDGDRVLAVVRGSAVNQDGRSNGLTAPNAIAQRDVIARSAARGRRDGRTRSTTSRPTAPAPCSAIRSSSRRSRRSYGRGEQPVRVGVRRRPTSGTSRRRQVLRDSSRPRWLCNAVAFRRTCTSPNGIRVSDPSPTRFFVPTENTPWPRDNGRDEPACRRSGSAGRTRMWCWSRPAVIGHRCVRAGDRGVARWWCPARPPDRVASWPRCLADWMAGAGAGVALADVAHTAQPPPRPAPPSRTVCAADPAQAVGGLRAVAAGQPAPGVVPAARRAVRSGNGVRVFGSGFAMGRDGPPTAGRRTRIRRRGRRVGARFRRRRPGSRYTPCWPAASPWPGSRACNRCWWGCSWR